MIDCHHWIPIMLEAERKERTALERENRRLRRILTDIRELTMDIKKPAPDWMSLVLQGQRAPSILQQQAAHDAASRQQSILNGLLGGFRWPF